MAQGRELLGQRAGHAARGPRSGPARCLPARRGPEPAADRSPPTTSARAGPATVAGCASRCAAAAGHGVRDWRGGRLRGDVLLQRRVRGLDCSISAVGDGRAATVLGVTEQLIGRRAFGVRGYRWCGNVSPPGLPADERGAPGRAGAGDLHLPGRGVRAARAVRRRRDLGRAPRLGARGQSAARGIARGARAAGRRSACSTPTWRRSPVACRTSTSNAGGAARRPGKGDRLRHARWGGASDRGLARARDPRRPEPRRRDPRRASGLHAARHRPTPQQVIAALEQRTTELRAEISGWAVTHA